MGCKYGDACRFKHDKMAAKKEKRCMACGMEGHFRSECPTISHDGKGCGETAVAGLSSGGPLAKAGPPPRPKSGPQLKGVEETDAPTGGNSKAEEALIAEAAELLKGVGRSPRCFWDKPRMAYVCMWCLLQEEGRLLEEGIGSEALQFPLRDVDATRAQGAIPVESVEG